MLSRKSTGLLAVLVLVPSLMLPACKSDGSNDKWIGAGVGTAVGALAGRAVAGKKNKTAGTIIGAVVGGVAGYAIAGGFGSKASAAERQTQSFKQANGEFDAGRAAQEKGDKEMALAHYKAASNAAPEHPEPYNNAGLIYLEQGDRANAEASFRKAVEVDPEFEPARQNLQQMGVSI